MADRLLIGFAAADITPPLGCQMAGFDARNGVAESIHDPLSARAIVLDDGAACIALVSVEVIGISAETTAQVRSEAHRKTGIPPEHVVLSATHTHCGPVTIKHFFNQGQNLDAAYLQHLADAIVRSIVEANASKIPRRLRSGLIKVDGIAINRRTADGQPIDPMAAVLLVEDIDGRIAAVVVNYACHTTTLGPNTLAITADFPYYTLKRLQEVLGDHVFPIYFNGAEGDLSIGHKSDLSAVGVIASFRTFEKAEELGSLLADTVIAGLSGLAEEQPILQAERRIAKLPLKTYKPLAEMTRAREEAALAIQNAGPDRLKLLQRSLFSRIEEYYAKLYEEAPGPVPKTLDAEMQGIRIGNSAVVSLPGEVFVGIALNIRQASPVRPMFLGLANDYIGYVPTPEASESSGYEVVASRVTPDAAEVIQTTAADLIGALQKRPGKEKTWSGN